MSLLPFRRTCRRGPQDFLAIATILKEHVYQPTMPKTSANGPSCPPYQGILWKVAEFFEMILDWEDFEIAARDLCAESPGKTRLLSKYRHSDGILTLKVTDGPTCLKFQTDKANDLKRFERLNRSMMATMLGVELEEPVVPDSSAIPSPLEATPSSGTPDLSSNNVSNDGKKKKKKKGKK